MDQLEIDALADHLPGWTVRSARADASDMEVLVTSPEHADHCRSCGADGHHLTGHGFNVSAFREVPIAGRRTLLSVRRRRHRCAQCNALGSQPLSLTDAGHRITVRCRERIVEQAARLPLAQVAEQIGVNRAVVQNLVSGGARRAGRPPQANQEGVAQCDFCRRVFDTPASMHVHHQPPTPGRNPGSQTSTLCPECHTHLARQHHKGE